MVVVVGITPLHWPHAARSVLTLRFCCVVEQSHLGFGKLFQHLREMAMLGSTWGHSETMSAGGTVQA